MAENKEIMKTENAMKIENTKKIPSLFDLNSNYNLGNIITQVQLKGDNYEEWQGPYGPR